MIPRADYQAIGDLRAKIEVLADRLGFELSSFIVEEYPGSEWEEPLEVKISIKQHVEQPRSTPLSLSASTTILGPR